MTKFEEIESVKAFASLATQGLVIINEGNRLMRSALEGLLTIQPNRTINVETINLDAKLAWNACNPDGYENGDDIKIISLTLTYNHDRDSKDIIVRYAYVNRKTNKMMKSVASFSHLDGIDPYDILNAYVESMQGNEMELEENITTDTIRLQNGKEVTTRSVYVTELKCPVLVTSESVEREIEEGSADDDNFYAYVPDHEFNTLTDDELKDWVEKNIN